MITGITYFPVLYEISDPVMYMNVSVPVKKVVIMGETMYNLLSMSLRTGMENSRPDKGGTE